MLQICLLVEVVVFNRRITIFIVVSIIICATLIASCKKNENETDKKSPYEVVVENGYTGTVNDWIISIISEHYDKSESKKSSYDKAVENGYSGSKSEWIETITGEKNSNNYNDKSLFEIVCDDGFDGSIDQWITEMVGNQGISGATGIKAYDDAVKNGYAGSLQKWIVSVVDKKDTSENKSVYETLVDKGYTGTITDLLNDLLKKEDIEEKQDEMKNEISIESSRLDEKNELIIELSDGTEINTEIIVEDKNTKTYTVTFKDWDGMVIKTEEVVQNGSANPPVSPTKEGYLFSGWDKSYMKINNDTEVIAVYRENIVNPTIYIEGKAAAENDNVEVLVNIKNNPGIAGAMLQLKYDENLILEKAEPGDAFLRLQYTKPGEYRTPCIFIWDSENEESSEDGNVLTLFFKVKNTAKKGERLNVSCSYRTGDIYDYDLKDINIDVINGYIFVE